MALAEVEAKLPGVRILPLKRFEDARGSLMELFREDDLHRYDFFPKMGYISVTHPGIARGPHEHWNQTDGFAFLNGVFRIYLWENRESVLWRDGVRHEGAKCVFEAGEAHPVFVIVPPGIVHAYRNIGDTDAYILNFPNALYKGWGRAELSVDEIRHEEGNSIFQLTP